jgi:hypothetical protein
MNRLLDRFFRMVLASQAEMQVNFPEGPGRLISCSPLELISSWVIACAFGQNFNRIHCRTRGHGDQQQLRGLDTPRLRLGWKGQRNGKVESIPTNCLPPIHLTIAVPMFTSVSGCFIQ